MDDLQRLVNDPYAAQISALQQKRALAEALRSIGQPQPLQNIGGALVGPNRSSQLAQLLGAIGGTYMGAKSDADTQNLIAEIRGKEQAARQGVFGPVNDVQKTMIPQSSAESAIDAGALGGASGSFAPSAEILSRNVQRMPSPDEVRSRLGTVSRDTMFGQQMRDMTEDMQLKQAFAKPEYEKVDLGGEWGWIDKSNPSKIVSRVSKSVSPDKQRDVELQLYKHGNASAGDLLSAGTQRRGQDITMRGQDLTNIRASERLDFEKSKASSGATATATKPMPVGAAQKLLENQENLRKARTALALIGGKAVGDMAGDPNAVGWKGYIPDVVLNRVDPEGIDTRAAIVDLGSMVVHDRSGAAVTASEMPRLRPFIPSEKDSSSTVKKKLSRFVHEYQQITNETSDFYRDSGYQVPMTPTEQKSRGASGSWSDESPKRRASDKVGNIKFLGFE